MSEHFFVFFFFFLQNKEKNFKENYIYREYYHYFIDPLKIKYLVFHTYNISL